MLNIEENNHGWTTIEYNNFSFPISYLTNSAIDRVLKIIIFYNINSNLMLHTSGNSYNNKPKSKVYLYRKP